MFLSNTVYSLFYPDKFENCDQHVRYVTVTPLHFLVTTEYPLFEKQLDKKFWLKL